MFPYLLFFFFFDILCLLDTFEILLHLPLLLLDFFRHLTSFMSVEYPPSLFGQVHIVLLCLSDTKKQKNIHIYIYIYTHTYTHTHTHTYIYICSIVSFSKPLLNCLCLHGKFYLPCIFKVQSLYNLSGLFFDQRQHRVRLGRLTYLTGGSWSILRIFCYSVHHVTLITLCLPY